MDALQIGATTLVVFQGDLTDQEVDAIVNAANSSLMGGGGVDGAIHWRGGPAILDACKYIRRTHYPEGLPTGEAVVTIAGDLPARRVIHTVGPIWHGGQSNAAQMLAKAYRNSLVQAEVHGLRTVAFPSISTGAFGFPIERAAPIALDTVAAYVRAHPSALREVRFVLFSPDDLEAYQSALKDLGAGAE
jgi:O-acetyl-ADP-ribose deacetylase (regulator of RNase III)